MLGGSERETESLRVADYMAYYRRVKAEFEAAVGGRRRPSFPPAATYPEPVEHCDVCRWVVDCRRGGARTTTCSSSPGSRPRQRRALKERAIAHRRGWPSSPCR